MEHLIIPEGYEPALNLHDTQIAIKTVKDFFQDLLAKQLKLLRVSAPLFVDPASGLNDNLNGVERPVSFDIKEQSGFNAEVVHSLAKWKRYALKEYGFSNGEGLYTDMNAIRRDETTDNIHSIFVDQWAAVRVADRFGISGQNRAAYPAAAAHRGAVAAHPAGDRLPQAGSGTAAAVSRAGKAAGKRCSTKAAGNSGTGKI